ncbi:unnamed protein product [Clonostachys rosea f. rosea IK726]|uniref:Uncharacterized protein n=1 Tax=Clonostachys rosea f. rosea IK726 TaxID=1349383 RepID=A0ACA9UPZ8_BIOOC|nr:unnamed protein product [Clonostachys rosea f. rosea IK726]
MPLKDLRCNNCVERQQGREALTEALLFWFRWLNYVEGDFAGYKEQIEDIFRENKGDDDLLDHGTVAVLRTQAAQFRELWRRMKHANPVLADEIRDDDYICLWMDDFSESEAEWAWLIACLEKVEENPGLLADWALTQNAGSLECWA